jgi:hypothetical protein
LLAFLLASSFSLSCRQPTTGTRATSMVEREQNKIGYWNVPRKGANFANREENAERLAAARRYGIQWIRLAPNQWKSAHPDYLIGDAAHFAGVVEEDLARLESVLDDADSLGLKVVLTTLSLPGARGRDDARIWSEERYQDQAAEFWGELAQRLRAHPAVVGYNILSAPHPEAASGSGGSAPGADLDRFNRKIVEAIRRVDRTTPIVIDAGRAADPQGFISLEPLADKNVLYSFRMFEPRRYTSRELNKERQHRYPGPVPASGGTEWNREELYEYMRPVIRWQSDHRIPSNRILVGEFGCDRRAKGAAAYLGDLIRIFDQLGWHWAFYAFRQDTSTEMDYELGDGPLGESYWRAKRRGREPVLRREPNPLFDVIRGDLTSS